MRKRQRGGRAQQELTRQVLSAYGRECWLKLPGCTKVATTKDHIVPYAQGGTDALENFRPACRACNSKRQNRNVGSLVRVITGPPASGKSTYVNQHAHPADVVIDMDKIARALMPDTGVPVQDEGATSSSGGAPSHVYPPHVRHVAIGARAAAIQRATRLRERVGVWIIHSIPSPEQLEEYKRMRWEVIRIDPGEAIVRERAAEQRPAHIMEVVTKWYEQSAAETADASASQLVEPSRDWGI